MCVGAQTPRSLLVPKRASVCAAERERRGRAYETLAMSPPSAKRKPVLQRRASTCCSARCGGGGTAPSAGGHTRCGRAGRPRRTTVWAAAGIGGHLRGIVPPASRRNEGPSSRPRQPSASVSPRDRRVVRGLGLLKLLPRPVVFARSFCPRGHAAAARPSRAPPSAHAQSRAISATAPVADGVGQEGLRGQRRPHEPLEMSLTCPSQPTVGAGVTTTGGVALLHKVGITAHRKEQEAPSRGLATF